MRKLLKKSTSINLLLLALFLTQLVGATYIFRRDYLSDRTPYWFDNLIQQSGWWILYGGKVYSPKNESSQPVYDPRLGWVDRSIKLKTYSGFTHSITKQSGEYNVKLGARLDSTSTQLSFPVQNTELFCIDGKCPVSDPRNIRKGSNVDIYIVEDLVNSENSKNIIVINE